jgi:hypothetical protein
MVVKETGGHFSETILNNFIDEIVDKEEKKNA